MQGGRQDGNIYDKLIFWLLAAAIFIIPLFLNIRTYDQFELPKLSLLRVLTCLMLMLWGLKSLSLGTFTWRKTPLDIPLALWVAANIISTFASVAPALSFRGEYENFAGSLTNINYVVLYFIAVNFPPILSCRS